MFSLRLGEEEETNGEFKRISHFSLFWQSWSIWSGALSGRERLAPAAVDLLDWEEQAWEGGREGQEKEDRFRDSKEDRGVKGVEERSRRWDGNK